MKSIIIATALLAGIAAAPAGAVTFAATNGSLNAFNASATGAQFTFEDAMTGRGGDPAGFTLTGGKVMTGNVSNVGANPFPAPGGNYYLSVNNSSVATVSAAALAGYQAISFYMGSIDAGNKVEVLGRNGAVLQTYSGSDLAAPLQANGSQTEAGTNRAITFFASGAETLTGLRFSSTVNSLEADNVRFIASVPEPATWAMMLMGFAMVGAGMRYRTRKTVATLATAAN